MPFHNRIFVVLSFEVVWPRRPRRPRKEPSEYFQQLHFWNQWVPLIKMHCRVCYLLDFDLKIHSGQVWVSISESFADWHMYDCILSRIIMIRTYELQQFFSMLLFFPVLLMFSAYHLRIFCFSLIVIIYNMYVSGFKNNNK